MASRLTWLGALLFSGLSGLSGLGVACSSDKKGEPDAAIGSGSVDGATGGTQPKAGTAQPGSTTPVVLGQQRSGQGTYYDFADGSGACMFDKSPEAMDVAALNEPDWAGSAWCGACADVTGPNGRVRIRIVDECPECKSGDLDFSPQAFEKIAAMSAGRVSISWSFVACDVSGPVRYRYKDGANIWWTAVQVQNSRLPITKLEFSKDGGSTFQSTERQDYNYFLTESGFGSGSVRVRITAVDGQALEDDLPTVQELLTVDGHAQFR